MSINQRVTLCYDTIYTRTSLVAQMVKRLSTMRETWVQSLGWGNPLEKEMAIHSRTIAWKIPWTEEPGRLQSMESQRVNMTERLHLTSPSIQENTIQPLKKCYKR